MSTLTNYTVGKGRLVHGFNQETGGLRCGSDSRFWHKRTKQPTTAPITCHTCLRIGGGR
ncbi:hypothetical protein [Amycolatopsis sp. YIM 10]|uniref:hypothetical protein n=1 Tax=Amycolatopsis sp. YIM 10 TaxID=2653857 RepID=UPI0012902F1B|nr:hypothetical protein [Amycolatopsis sp. YIM 10]QFU87836.1 hypothetical protein YIM_13250 [Amycolatopsis sp. YIM 10]QFU94851.1 hypothetical protein YIM_48630 [Amycolatopsis sp. YIM 10]